MQFGDVFHHHLLGFVSPKLARSLALQSHCSHRKIHGYVFFADSLERYHGESPPKGARGYNMTDCHNYDIRITHLGLTLQSFYTHAGVQEWCAHLRRVAHSRQGCANPSMASKQTTRLIYQHSPKIQTLTLPFTEEKKPERQLGDVPAKFQGG